MSSDKKHGEARGRLAQPIQFFTIAEVAEYLAVATRTVRRWIASGDLVAHRFRGMVRIAEEDLRRFLKAHRGDDE